MTATLAATQMAEYAAAAQELADYFIDRAPALDGWHCCSGRSVSLELVQFFPYTRGDNRGAARRVAQALGGTWRSERDHDDFRSWRGRLKLPSGNGVEVLLHEVERDETQAIDLGEAMPR